MQRDDLRGRGGEVGAPVSVEPPREVAGCGAPLALAVENLTAVDPPGGSSPLSLLSGWGKGTAVDPQAGRSPVANRHLTRGRGMGRPCVATAARSSEPRRGGAGVIRRPTVITNRRTPITQTPAAAATPASQRRHEPVPNEQERGIVVYLDEFVWKKKYKHLMCMG